MITMLAAAALATPALPAEAPKTTNFAVRTVPGEMPRAAVQSPVSGLSTPRSGDIREAAVLGSKWGRVTSTWRTAQRNRAVGGVRNSYHLSGRAIDIARRSGVRHADIAAAYRRAGYTLIESLDEGDHSHFAFGSARAPRVFAAPMATAETNETKWRMVSVPSSASR